MCYYVNRNKKQLLKGENSLIQFTQNLKQLRKARGLSRQELADMSGISSAAIGYYETGKREPQASTLVSIATALHVSVDDLLGRDNVTTFFHNLGFWIRPNELLGKDFVAFVDMESDLDEVYPAPKEALLPIMEQLKKDSREQQREELLGALRSSKKDLEQHAANLMNQQLKNDFGIDMDKLFKMIQGTPPQLLQHLNENTWITDLIKLHTEQPTPAPHKNADATPPAQDHDDADDEPATEKGPHSKE